MAEQSNEVDNCSDSEKEQDEELDAILDNALEDFEKAPSGLGNFQRAESAECSAEQLWNDEFLLEAQKHFEQNMKAFFEGGDGNEPVSSERFGQQLQKMAEEANKVLTEHASDPNFSSTIAETLRNLSENCENLQAELGDDITAMLGGLGLGGTEESPDILPFMQNMMQSFLSKEVLYPSIKEIAQKYPSWLEEQKGSLSEEQYDNFSKQMHLMEDVCTEFETESLSDSEDIKKARFTKILSLMEEMQKLGQPPKELIGEGSPFTYDENGKPNPLPGMDPAQCTVM